MTDRADIICELKQRVDDARGDWCADLDLIVRLAALLYGLPAHAIYTSARNAPVIEARDAVVWVARQTTILSYPMIAERFGMGHPGTTFAPQHDVVWFATKGSGFQFPAGRPASVLRFRNVPASQRFHSTQKPDALMRELVKRLTPPGGIVYDPCMGSGSTGVAAVAAGFRFVGVELDDHNFAVAQKRVRQAARTKAKRAAPIHATPARRAVA